MRIAPGLRDAIVEHARADAPNECCGVVATRDGIVVGVHPAGNVAASPFRFEIDSLDLLRLVTDIENRGEDLGAIYHSHTRSPAYPSQTDVNFAAGWPGVEWIIVGLAGDGEPEFRSFRIDGGVIDEVGIDVGDV
jgi:[CysO sulfur-carrier protein]-S-L-cysteine hydrolase